MIAEHLQGHGTGGRPPAHEVEERRRHLIAVATRLFTSGGYAATSLEKIAKAAGASKTTIYRNFGDKAELFRSVLNSFVEPIWPKLSDVSTEGKAPGEVLQAFGTLIISPSIINSDTVMLLRLVYRESQRFPELARIFSESEQTTIDVLAGYLALATRQKQLRLTDFAWSANQFLEMVWGTLSRRLIIGTTQLPDEGERRRIVDTAVALFLNGVLEPVRSLHERSWPGGRAGGFADRGS